MKWQLNNETPIYYQLVGVMRLGIVSGALAPGERMASVRDLASEAGVNPNTMQRALAELEREGLVFAQRTSGRFVTEDREMIDSARKTMASEQIRGFLDSMARLGYLREDIVTMLNDAVKEENGNVGL